MWLLKEVSIFLTPHFIICISIQWMIQILYFLFKSIEVLSKQALKIQVFQKKSPTIGKSIFTYPTSLVTLGGHWKRVTLQRRGLSELMACSTPHVHQDSQ